MKKKRRLLIILVQAAVVWAVLGVAGTVGFLEYSAGVNTGTGRLDWGEGMGYRKIG